MLKKINHHAVDDYDDLESKNNPAQRGKYHESIPTGRKLQDWQRGYGYEMQFLRFPYNAPTTPRLFNNNFELWV
jgi:hypothetical protein